MLPDDGFARTYHPVVIGHHSSYPSLGNTFKDASNRSGYRAERRTTDVRCRETVLDTGGWRMIENIYSTLVVM